MVEKIIDSYLLRLENKESYKNTQQLSFLRKVNLNVFLYFFFKKKGF